MIIKTGCIFNSDNNAILSKTILGNPASVIILESDELDNDELLKSVAVQENKPISCFVKQKSKDNEFDIRFFTPSGDEINICGHGSLISGKILKEHFNIKEDNIILHLNKNICIGNMLNEDDPVETIYFSKNNNVSVKLLRIPYEKGILDKNEQKTIDGVLDTLNINSNRVADQIKSEEYHDLIIILKDVNDLRNIKPNFNKIIPYCKKINDLRSISFSAKSNLSGFDYETRVFAPHINVEEDIVCVSINSVISDYWSRILNKTDLNVLYPYHWNDDICGGIQHIVINKNSIIVSDGL